MGFKVNEIDDVITSCVAAWISFAAMFVQPSFQVVGDSGVEKTSKTVAKDVNVISPHAPLLPCGESLGKGHRIREFVCVQQRNPLLMQLKNSDAKNPVAISRQPGFLMVGMR